MPRIRGLRRQHDCCTKGTLKRPIGLVKPLSLFIFRCGYNLRIVDQFKFNALLQTQAAARAKKYAAMRSLGLTLDQIARAEGISRQRVSQLLIKHGFNKRRVRLLDAKVPAK